MFSAAVVHQSHYASTGTSECGSSVGVGGGG